MPPTGRLAPSPTGLLHLGNARSLLGAWLSARSRHGRILLRIEDLLPDMAAHEAGLLQDLTWLGLDWDAPDPETAGLITLPPQAGFVRQSERAVLHTQILARLQAAGLVYPCVCTRKDIDRAAYAPHADEQGQTYPGTCRDRFASEAEALDLETERAHREHRPPLGVALRLRVPAEPVTFQDALHGPRTVTLPQTCGDLVVRRKDGGFAYMFAVVADDLDMGVTEVVRGDDLLDATGQQLAVYQALAHAGVGQPEPFWQRARTWTPPTWVHLPLVLGDDGRRLAKRNQSVHLRHLREAGVPARAVRRWLAESLGLAGTTELVEMAERFDLAQVPRGPVRFGARELAGLVE
jgi:glutamyl-tRNA synthetase